jgi:hypothetical protein
LIVAEKRGARVNGFALFRNEDRDFLVGVRLPRFARVLALVVLVRDDYRAEMLTGRQWRE